MTAVWNNTDPTRTDVDREQTRRIGRRLHVVIANASGNPQLSSIIIGLGHQTQFFDLKSLPEWLTDKCNEHLAIVSALLTGDGDATASAMKLHLEIVSDGIIARLS